MRRTKVEQHRLLPQIVLFRRLHGDDEASQFRFRFQILDPLQFRPERRDPSLLNRALIHAGGVIIANLLIGCSAAGIGFGRALQNVAQD